MTLCCIVHNIHLMIDLQREYIFGQVKTINYDKQTKVLTG